MAEVLKRVRPLSLEMIRSLARWMRKTELIDAALCGAAEEMARGLIDADLGGGVVKKRIGMAGRGKSGSAQTLVASEKGSNWFFVYGFEKNDKGNISEDELEALQTLAKDLLARTGQQLDTAVTGGAWQEICHDEKSQAQKPDSRSSPRDRQRFSSRGLH